MRRKDIKMINDIGKKIYNFDCELEKKIYCNLSFIDLKKKKVKKLNEKLKFNYYIEWEQYVYNKYKDFDIVNLKEFSRYLNQKIRNTEPTREYWSICIPIMLSMIITNFPKMLIDNGEMEFSGLSFQTTIILVFCIFAFLFFIIILLIYFVYRIIIPLWDCNTDKYFLLDYKEIIDKMIEKKQIIEEDTNHQ